MPVYLIDAQKVAENQVNAKWWVIGAVIVLAVALIGYVVASREKRLKMNLENAMRDLNKPISEKLLQRWDKFCKTKAYKKARFRKARMRLWK